MCCDRPANPLRAIISRRMLLTLACAMTLVASVAVALGWDTLNEGLGPGHWGRATAEYFWISFWISAAAVLALAAGYAVTLLVSRGIAKPIAALARRADEATEKGGTASFPTDSGIVEIDSLATSFNRLFALQEQQSQELRELTRNILHDIRTPLSHISQQAEGIFDGSCEPRNAAGIIAEFCEKILDLFETHAEIARNNACAELEQPTSQDIASIIGLVVNLYEPAAAAKGVKLSFSGSSQPIVFSGHKSKLERLLSNLVDNALKFTPEGGSVAVTAFQTIDAVEISVSDTGIGIDQTMQRRIFERGFRTKDAVSQPGFGLGLALVQSIVTFYQGTVACHSEPGKGTTFTVRLPT